MALTGQITDCKVVGTPKVGDTLKLEVVYKYDCTENENPATYAVVAYAGTKMIGWDNTSLAAWDARGTKSVQFSCNYGGYTMPSVATNITLDLWAHPDAYQKIEDYL